MYAWRWTMYGAAFTLSMAVGCANRAERYTPEPALARASLTAALTAWRDGHSADALPVIPAIQWVDTSRKPDQRLRSFRILSEQPTGAAGRAFVVRLSLENPTADQRVRYIVVGIDPIWVFHKDDYDRLAHWEHPMEPVAPTEDSQDRADEPSSSAPLNPAIQTESAANSASNHARN